MRPVGVDPKRFLIAIGAEVRRRRVSANLSQVKLAQLARLHPNVIGRLERGTYNPTIATLCGIAGALNTSLVGVMAQAEPTSRVRGVKRKAV
jgi:transcriptional regulator with XRE-family HTH domain